MTICFKEIVFVLAVFSVIFCACAQYVASDEIKKPADSIHSTEATLTFQRNCVNDSGCHFKSDKVKGQVQLTCNQGKCQCRNPSFPVQNGSRNYYVRVLNNECRVSDSGPCGTTDGITVECEEGKFCIEGRCRSQIHKREKYSLCDEDIDCQKRLQCVDKEVPPIVSYCREPIPPTIAFDRECKSDRDCDYKNTKTRDHVYLACKQGKCQCGLRERWPEDVSIYPVSVLNDSCVVSRSGPCGTANGITLVCEDGEFCIEGRCRSEIRSAAKNSYCYEDIDCEEGLKCVEKYIFPFSLDYCGDA